MQPIQYVGNDNVKIKVDEVHRLCDGTYFVGQNEQLGRCFGVMNEKGDMWYIKQLDDDEIAEMKKLADDLKDSGYWDIVCTLAPFYGMND